VARLNPFANFDLQEIFADQQWPRVVLPRCGNQIFSLGIAKKQQVSVGGESRFTNQSLV
jgi:hypothetical protein